MRSVLALAFIGGLSLNCAQGEAYITPDEVPDGSHVWLQGEYVGTVDGAEVGAQVADVGGGAYELILYEGGLPGKGWDPNTEELRGVIGQLEDGAVTFNYGDYRGVAAVDGTLTITHRQRGEVGALERTVRQGPTLSMAPPAEATVLFDGTNVDMWRDGAEMTENGLLVQGARTAEDYGDMFMHLEYMIPYWEPDGDQANSGVYVQNRYEVQILESFGRELAPHQDGSLYNEKAPEILATLPPLQWQTFDILFRAPRFDEDGEKTENMRISVFQNGVLIHDGVELEGGTGAGGGRTPPEVEEYHTWLQDHTGEIRFRNIWIVEGAQDWPDEVKEALELD